MAILRAHLLSRRTTVCHLAGAGLLGLAGALAAEGRTSEDFVREAMRLRTEALRRISPKVIMDPTVAGSPQSGFETGGTYTVSGRYPWKSKIATTVFWVGEPATPENPVSNENSAWIIDWRGSYGGYDPPDSSERHNFIPKAFVPKQNPFYAALPYNDVEDHRTKDEAAHVIPWFKVCYVRDGQSVCKGRWLAIRHGNKVCYAQWEDVGPYKTDHWKYVFGNERPRPNPNHDAGLDVSPAVREYLGLGGIDVCDWKFVDFVSVPSGPWSLYGDNNTFVQVRRRNAERNKELASRKGPRGKRPNPSNG